METNSKKVLEAMPSFDDFMSLAEEIKEISVEKMRLENEIKATEAATFTRVMSDSAFFVGGKPVSVSFYENAYKFSGVGGGLLELRNELANVVATLELKRNQFEVYKSMHDLFKVLVYQERVLT